jgi:hypothetical protein
MGRELISMDAIKKESVTENIPKKRQRHISPDDGRYKKPLPINKKRHAAQMKRDGVPWKEIAEYLGVSLNTAKAHLTNVSQGKTKTYRVLPRGVKLPALNAYLRGGGDPKSEARLRELVYQDTEVSCSRKLLYSYVDRWRELHLKRYPEWLRLAHKAIEIYYEVYPRGKDGFVKIHLLWPEVLKNSKLIDSDEPAEGQWVEFFKLVKDRESAECDKTQDT